MADNKSTKDVDRWDCPVLGTELYPFQFLGPLTTSLRFLTMAECECHIKHMSLYEVSTHGQLGLS